MSGLAPGRARGGARSATLSVLVALARHAWLSGSSAGTGPGVSRRPRSDQRRRSDGVKVAAAPAAQTVSAAKSLESAGYPQPLQRRVAACKDVQENFTVKKFRKSGMIPCTIQVPGRHRHTYELHQR